MIVQTVDISVEHNAMRFCCSATEMCGENDGGDDGD